MRAKAIRVIEESYLIVALNGVCPMLQIRSMDPVRFAGKLAGPALDPVTYVPSHKPKIAVHDFLGLRDRLPLEHPRLIAGLFRRFWGEWHGLPQSANPELDATPKIQWVGQRNLSYAPPFHQVQLDHNFHHPGANLHESGHAAIAFSRTRLAYQSPGLYAQALVDSISNNPIPKLFARLNYRPVVVFSVQTRQALVTVITEFGKARLKALKGELTHQAFIDATNDAIATQAAKLPPGLQQNYNQALGFLFEADRQSLIQPHVLHATAFKSHVLDAPFSPEDAEAASDWVSSMAQDLIGAQRRHHEPDGLSYRTSAEEIAVQAMEHSGHLAMLVDGFPQLKRAIHTRPDPKRPIHHQPEPWLRQSLFALPGGIMSYVSDGLHQITGNLGRFNHGVREQLLIPTAENRAEIDKALTGIEQTMALGQAIDAESKPFSEYAPTVQTLRQLEKALP